MNQLNKLCFDVEIGKQPPLQIICKLKQLTVFAKVNFLLFVASSSVSKLLLQSLQTHIVFRILFRRHSKKFAQKGSFFGLSLKYLFSCLFFRMKIFKAIFTSKTLNYFVTMIIRNTLLCRSSIFSLMNYLKASHNLIAKN